jgi:hypothetical protein
MIAGFSLKGLLFFYLGLLSLNLKSVLAQGLRTFALEGGISAAAENDDYICSATKGCKFDQRNRHLILLTKTAEMIRAKVFVGLVLTSAVMAASPRATTKSNAVLAGDSNGRMLLHAH